MDSQALLNSRASQEEQQGEIMGGEQRIGEDDYADDGDEDYGYSNSDEEEEFDRREFGIYQCLPVEPGEPDWESGEAETVEEYLRRVRFEARQLPDVVTRSVPQQASQQLAADAPHSQQQHEQQQGQGQRPHYAARYLAADPGVPPCDDRLKPSAAWIRDFLRQFAHLRCRLQREHELTSGQAVAGGLAAGGSGARLLGGSSLDATAAAAQQELAELSLDPPSALMPELQQLQGCDQLQVRRHLHSAIRQVTQEESLTPEAGAQLYALSARIEKPLHAGTCALYRQLLRHCAAQRAALGGGGGSSGGDGATDPLLPHLNILICIAGAFFGQDEELAAMWDDDEEDY